MKRFSALVALVFVAFFYQNCAQNDMNFEYADQASALGIGLKLVPNDENVHEIENPQKYTLEVTLPEKGEIQKENIEIDGKRVEFIKNAVGNYEFSFIPGTPNRYKIYAEVWTPTGAHFDISDELRILDDHPPIVTITPDSENKYEDILGQIQKFDLQVVDVGGGHIRSVHCSIDAAATDCSVNSSGTGSLSLSNLRQGLHSLVVEAVDNFGNRRAVPHEFSIGADLTAPVVTVQELPTNTYYSIDSQSFAVSANDPHTGLQSVTCIFNGRPMDQCPPLSGGSVTALLPTTQLRLGINTIIIRALDNSVKGGVSNPNETVVAHSFEIKNDSVAPLVVLTKNNANTNLVNQLQRVAFQVSDADSGLNTSSLHCLVNGSAQSCQMNASGVGEIQVTPSAVGTLTVSVSISDRYGNSNSASTTLDIARDSSVPKITVTEDSSNPSVIVGGSSLRYNFTVQKDGNLSTLASVRCYSDSTVVSCNAASDLKSGFIRTSFAVAGQHRVLVEATDSTGNIGQRSVDIIVRKLIPSSTNLAVNEIKALDILIVIDDSASMQEEQKNMADRIESFTSHLTALDWRAGVITTDIVLSDRVGRLQPIVGLNSRYWVSKSTPGVQKLIGDTVQGAGLAGNGDEQGIKASNILIANKDNAPNAGFFRNGAALAILYISDERESGSTSQNSPEALVQLVQKLWPGKPFRAHSIVMLPTKCAGLSVGTKYIELSNMTAGQVGCVGNANYSATLSGMGQSSAQLVNGSTLTCRPYQNQVTITRAGVAQNLPYTVSGRNLTFSSALPIGQYVLSYRCVQ